MHPRQSPSPALLRLADAQAGALTREQVLAFGLSRHSLARLVADGAWCRLAEGVVSVTPQPGWLTVAWAGILVGGDRARLGGLAAGHLAGLLDGPPDEIVIWVGSDTPTRQPEPPYLWHFRSDRRGLRGPVSTGCPPRIRNTDVVLDLVAETDPARVVALVTAAAQRRVASPAQLRRALDRRAVFRHRALLSELLDDVAAGAQSPLEMRYLRDVERPHGLPTGRRQVRRGRSVVDVVYELHRLLVELDGRLGHDGMGRFKDMRRDNRALRAGLNTLRYGWGDVVGNPCGVAGEVGEVLRLLGWEGLPTACGRCERLVSGI